MNNVILFRPADSPRRMASGDRGAEILFFTGVRYQRMGESPPAPAAGLRPARRKRQAAEVGRKGQR
jgi:hypothetical protein